MKRFILAALCVLLPALSMAAPVRKDIEGSMVVTGDIQVTKDGEVSGFTLDRPNDLPDVVKSLASQALPHWRFAPVKVDGQAVNATSKMRLRFVTRPADDGNFTVAIAGASFGDEHQDGQLWFKQRSAPKYPPGAVAARVTGTVILLLKVDRDGNVANAAAERVNLGSVGTESEMRMFRGMLADACLRRARTWQFTPPTKGPDVGKNEWYVRVPVSSTSTAAACLHRGMASGWCTSRARRKRSTGYPRTANLPTIRARQRHHPRRRIAAGRQRHQAADSAELSPRTHGEERAGITGPFSGLRATGFVLHCIGIFCELLGKK